MGDTDTRMSPGLCLLACLHLSTLTPWGDSQPQLLSLLPFCIERLNNASQSLKAIFIPLSFVGITPPSFCEMYKMTGPINCKKYFRNSGRSACDPQGSFKKTKGLIVAVCHYGGSLCAWQHCDTSSFSDLLLSDILLIIMSILRCSMLLVLKRCSWHTSCEITALMIIISAELD